MNLVFYDTAKGGWRGGAGEVEKERGKAEEGEEFGGGGGGGGEGGGGGRQKNKVAK